MKFTKGADVNMTGLRGYVRTTFRELSEVFGKPDYGPENYHLDKTTCEWRLQFEDGAVACIYDYKEQCTPYHEHEWHVGGHDDIVVTYIQALINLHRDPLIRMVREFQPNARVSG